MNYISTRGLCAPAAMEEAIFAGRAPDGGLFIPERMPRVFSSGDIAILAWLSHGRRLAHIMSMFFSSIRIDTLAKAAEAIYGRDPYGAKAVSVKELDGCSSLVIQSDTAHTNNAFAAAILPPLYAASGMRRKLVMAVSAEDSSQLADVNRLSSLDGLHLLLLSGMGPLAQGSFDETERLWNGRVRLLDTGHAGHSHTGLIQSLYCDRAVVKTAAENGVALASAGMDNWLCVLSKTVMFLSGYCEMVLRRHIRFGDPICLCISGHDDGDLLSAYYAKSMGLPVERIVCAVTGETALASLMTGNFTHSGLSANLERLARELERSAGTPFPPINTSLSDSAASLLDGYFTLYDIRAAGGFPASGCTPSPDHIHAAAKKYAASTGKRTRCLLIRPQERKDTNKPHKSAPSDDFDPALFTRCRDKLLEIIAR